MPRLRRSRVWTLLCSNQQATRHATPPNPKGIQYLSPGLSRPAGEATLGKGRDHLTLKVLNPNCLRRTGCKGLTRGCDANLSGYIVFGFLTQGNSTGAE